MTTLAIIQARYSSQRFPGKMLATLDGKPLIQHVIERANQIRGVDAVILALANEPEERPLWKWAVCSAPCGVIVASPNIEMDDVLGRFADVALRVPNADPIMRLTGDCVLLQPEVCERVLERYRSVQDCDYAWTDTASGDWPDGTDCEVFSRRMLLAAHAQALDPYDREHVTSWMRRHTVVESLPADPAYAGWPKVSVDTEEDLARVEAHAHAR